MGHGYRPAAHRPKGNIKHSDSKGIRHHSKDGMVPQSSHPRGHETARGLFGGAVEVDETYMGGKEKNKHAFKKLKAGRGTIGKKAIAGVLQRGGMVAAKPIDSTDRETLYGFIKASVQKSATIYTDDHRSYLGMEGDHHEAVKHSIGEYIREQAHTHYSQSPARTLCRDG